MKKSLIFIFILLISCGPSEAEIQSQIDEAVNQALETSTSTTSSTTSTIIEIERINWEPTSLDIIGCPSIRDLNITSNFRETINIRFEAVLGDNVNRITYQLFLNEDETDIFQLNSEIDPTINWEKGTTVTGLEIGFPLEIDLYYFKYEVTVYEAAGNFTKVCEIDTTADFNNLPPFATFTNCPETAQENSELKLEYSVVARSDDISFIQFEFQDGSRDKNFDDLIINNNLPKKSNLSNLSITYYIGNVTGERNLSIVATIFDTQNRQYKIACGIRLQPTPTTTTTTTTTVPDLNYKFMGRKTDGLFPESTISDIDGLRICAVNRTSTTDALLDIVELNNPIIEYVMSNSINDSFQKFLSGVCDLMFQEVSVLNELKLQDSRNGWVIFPENENY